MQALGDRAVPVACPAKHPSAMRTVPTGSPPGFGQALAAKPTSPRTSNWGGSCLNSSSLPAPALGVFWGGCGPLPQQDTEPGALRPWEEGGHLCERPIPMWLCQWAVPRPVLLPGVELPGDASTCCFFQVCRRIRCRATGIASWSSSESKCPDLKALALPPAGDALGVLPGTLERPRQDPGAPVQGSAAEQWGRRKRRSWPCLGALKSSPLRPLGFSWSFLQDSHSAWLIHSY